MSLPLQAWEAPVYRYMVTRHRLREARSLRLLESPQKRISQVLRRQASLEEKAVKDQLRLLAQMRKYILGEIADAAGYQSFHLNQLLTAVDNYVDRVESEASAAIGSDAADMFALGHELVDAPLAAAGIDVGSGDSLTGISSELLNAAIRLTSGEIGDVFTELGTGLKSAIRRAALGAQSPSDVTAAVAKLVNQKRNPFTTAQYDAERIVRTEINRVFGAASHDRMKSANKTMGGGLKKAWLTAGDSRVRDEHQQAADDYGVDNAIPVGEAFIVDGEELQFPLDPRGSASNTINCRCVSLPVVGEVGSAAAADAEEEAA